MATYTEPAGSRTSLTTTALNSLASNTYVSAGTIDVSSTDPIDVIIEVEATPGTITAPSFLNVFAQSSFDNSNFSTGPTSGSTATDEPVLHFIGSLPLPTNSTLQRKSFSVKAALGFVPPYFKVICRNVTGATLAASGHAVNYTTYTGSIT